MHIATNTVNPRFDRRRTVPERLRMATGVQEAEVLAQDEQFDGCGEGSFPARSTMEQRSKIIKQGVGLSRRASRRQTAERSGCSI